MLQHIISAIKPLETNAMEKCQIRLDNLTKPLGSLNAFEHLARQMAGITGNPRPRNLGKSIIVLTGDHGVALAEQSPYLQGTTASMTDDFYMGSAAINTFAAHVSAKVVLVDISVAADLSSFPQMRHEKIACGTENIAVEAAMTREQAMQAIEAGIKIAQQEIAKGVRILGLGAMGLGNTIASTALVACYSAMPVANLVKGDIEVADEAINHKIQVIETALAVNCPAKNDPLDVLSKVGGLELAGLVGVILGGVSGGAAIVLDDLATSAAALIAVQIAPSVREYLIGSHFSVDPAHKIALKIINVPAYLDLDMNLGAGTGAALGMSLIDAALHMLNDMKTFGEAEVAIAQDGPGALKQRRDIKE